ncbi:glycoprotein 3-alpha-L-fucosyltransferase A [Condylostylus longicornis]|uniref:glycoprotein 3-alpha-L-fucosyltransferase A n=1 Tax=Condylostylus longicornis TaxID=2530218 RepID=UPI00244E2C33|nr:glycoprotein 3-alpha-L-fucosyltransferase A [Condylostylus longicornis]
MRLPKISLKRCFFLTLVFALLLLFGFNLRDREPKSTQKVPQLSPLQQSLESKAERELKTQPQQITTAIFDTFKENNNEINVNYNKNNNNIKNIDIKSQNKNSNLIFSSNSYDEIKISDPDIPRSRAWYFQGGEKYPPPVRRKNNTKRKVTRLFPPDDPNSDRIKAQLMFVPHNYEQIKDEGRLKTILLYNGLAPWNVKKGQDVFISSRCPVDTCQLTSNREKAVSADMILYKDHYIATGTHRPSKQVYMLYFLECPYHTEHVRVPDAFNWTSTYRKDSDIVAPYEKWEYYNDAVKQMKQERNYALNKTKKVAWFVSNCGARNGRLAYAHELQKYIDVDIYGSCGSYKCSRNTADKCFEILDRDYKFYLAFENSNCKDYITEKFFVNALNRNILPIVMGARPEDYEKSAPYKSYIHIDEFASPKELADYLHILDKNDNLYNSYFKWKGTGEFINTYFWCRVCAALHDEDSLKKPRWYHDVNEWWRGPGVCTTGSWRSFKARKDVISDDK